MISVARYFLGNECLGESQIDTKLAKPYSWAYFCSTCGEIWARVWVEGAIWKIVQRPCEQHTWVGVWDCREHSGSLLDSALSMDFVGAYAWAIVLEYLPRSVLLRELLLMLQKLENDNAEQT